MSYLAALVAFLLLAAPAALASDFSASAKGTGTGRFLQLGAGARAAGLGEAYTALADDASALYWNPAALTRTQAASALFMHAPYLGSSFFDYAAYAQNLGPGGALGLGVQYFSAGKIIGTDDTGSENGTFAPNDLALSLGYAYKFSERPSEDGLSLGLSGKYARSRIINTAQTFTCDIGLLAPAVLDGRLSLGAAAVNLGGKMKFESEAESLPRAFRLGAGYHINPDWLAGIDLALPMNNQPYVAAGTEYVLRMSEGWDFAGRVGFNSRTVGDVPGLSGCAFGVGVVRSGLSIDYAIAPMGDIGMTHRVSVSLRFAARQGSSAGKAPAKSESRRRASPRQQRPAGGDFLIY